MAEAKEFIQKVSKDHKTANHNCWAYVVGQKAENEHASDAGEPSGSAGKPMLNALKKHNMTNVAAVVTRYFGGVKLGIRGLIDAYGQAVEEAIEQKPLKKLVNYSSFYIVTTYDFAEVLKYQLSELNCEITKADYTAEVGLAVEIEEPECEALEQYLQELSTQNKISYKSI
jgi:uncharacterized YigZ family protein